jgi:hypothetical protein
MKWPFFPGFQAKRAAVAARASAPSRGGTALLVASSIGPD